MSGLFGRGLGGGWGFEGGACGVQLVRGMEERGFVGGGGVWGWVGFWEMGCGLEVLGFLGAWLRKGFSASKSCKHLFAISIPITGHGVLFEVIKVLRLLCSYVYQHQRLNACFSSISTRDLCILLSSKIPFLDSSDSTAFVPLHPLSHHASFSTANYLKQPFAQPRPQSSLSFLQQLDFRFHIQHQHYLQSSPPLQFRSVFGINTPFQHLHRFSAISGRQVKQTCALVNGVIVVQVIPLETQPAQ